MFPRLSLSFALSFPETLQYPRIKSEFSEAMLSWVSICHQRNPNKYGYPFLPKSVLGSGGGQDSTLALKVSLSREGDSHANKNCKTPTVEFIRVCGCLIHWMSRWKWGTIEKLYLNILFMT